MEPPIDETKFTEFKPSTAFLKKNYLYSIIFGLILSAPATAIYFFLHILPILIIPIIVAGLFMIFAKLFYNALNYEITKSEIVIKSGVIFKKEVIIPLRTITNIDVFSGPVDRIFDIAMVNIQTAGRASMLAEGRFMGLLTEDANQLRNLLKQKLQKIQGGDGTAIDGSTTTDQNSPVEKVLTELREIKNVLIDIRDKRI